MTDLVTGIAIVLIWVGLQVYVLPRLGVPT